MHRVFPTISSSDARHSQVIPVLHRRLQVHLRHEAGSHRHPRQQDEHRWVGGWAGGGLGWGGWMGAGLIVMLVYIG